MLPLSFVANSSFPYEQKLDEARRFLAGKGITNPRPIRRSVPHSEAYEAWLARSRPRLRLISSRALAH
jgi:hypothetical protein